MYKIERRPSGYILTFSGVITLEEINNWYKDSEEQLLFEDRESFGVIINMKDLIPLAAKERLVMVEGQKLYKDKGMRRSAVILKNNIICQQFKNLAIQSGIYKTERYIDASAVPNPVEMAIDWVNDAIDPDL